MAKHRVGSQINAKRTRSVTTSGAQTRKLVEERTGVPYAAPHISFDKSTGKRVEMPPRPDPASEVHKNMTDHLKANGRLPEPEARPHVSHKVRKPAPKGRIVIASQFVHPDIAAHVLIAYWQQVRYWDGLIEADRRSQAAPVVELVALADVETAAAQDPAPEALSITDAIAQRVADNLSKPEQLAAHKPMTDEQQAELGRFAKAHGATWAPKAEPPDDTDDYPLTPRQIVALALGAFHHAIYHEGRKGHRKDERINLGYDLWVRSHTTPKGQNGLFVYHKDHPEVLELIGHIADDGSWREIEAVAQHAITAVVEHAGIGDPNVVIEDDPFGEQEVA